MTKAALREQRRAQQIARRNRNRGIIIAIIVVAIAAIAFFVIRDYTTKPTPLLTPLPPAHPVEIIRLVRSIPPRPRHLPLLSPPLQALSMRTSRRVLAPSPRLVIQYRSTTPVGSRMAPSLTLLSTGVRLLTSL